MLQTMLDLDAKEDIVSYHTHRGDDVAEATVNLKDLKARSRPCSLAPCPEDRSLMVPRRRPETRLSDVIPAPCMRH